MQLQGLLHQQLLMLLCADCKEGEYMNYYMDNSRAIASLSSWQGWLLMLIRVLAGLFILYYIFRWITAEGESQAADAKYKLRIVGLIFILALIVPFLVTFVISVFS